MISKRYMSCKHYAKENRMNTIIIDEDNVKAKKIIRETLYDKRVNATRRQSSAKYIYMNQPQDFKIHKVKVTEQRTIKGHRLETPMIFFNKLAEQGDESVGIQED